MGRRLMGLQQAESMIAKGKEDRLNRVFLSKGLEPDVAKYLAQEKGFPKLQAGLGETLVDIVMSFMETYQFDELFDSFEQYIYSSICETLHACLEGAMAWSWITDFPANEEELINLLERVEDEAVAERVYKLCYFRSRSYFLHPEIRERYIECLPTTFKLMLEKEDVNIDLAKAVLLKWSPVMTISTLQWLSELGEEEPLLIEDMLQTRLEFRQIDIFEVLEMTSIATMSRVKNMLVSRLNPLNHAHFSTVCPDNRDKSIVVQKIIQARTLLKSTEGQTLIEWMKDSWENVNFDAVCIVILALESKELYNDAIINIAGGRGIYEDSSFVGKMKSFLQHDTEMWLDKSFLTIAKETELKTIERGVASGITLSKPFEHFAQVLVFRDIVEIFRSWDADTESLKIYGDFGQRISAPQGESLASILRNVEKCKLYVETNRLNRIPVEETTFTHNQWNSMDIPNMEGATPENGLNMDGMRLYLTKDRSANEKFIERVKHYLTPRAIQSILSSVRFSLDTLTKKTVSSLVAEVDRLEVPYPSFIQECAMLAFDSLASSKDITEKELAEMAVRCLNGCGHSGILIKTKNPNFNLQTYLKELHLKSL